MAKLFNWVKIFFREVQMDIVRVKATDAALELINEIKKDYPNILFHQSGGCCDGSSPMCYPADDYRVGSNDIELGQIDGVPFFISESQFDVWKHTQLILDVVPGRGGMFSLDNGREKRFLTRSRMFEDSELKQLGIEKPSGTIIACSI
ncbi:MAG: DUF779 domain-containing protein [Caulobacterales bacterium]|nr:DUF779 domain-containing protein [Caulobacterales bacterium]